MHYFTNTMLYNKCTKTHHTSTLLAILQVTWRVEDNVSNNAEHSRLAILGVLVLLSLSAVHVAVAIRWEMCTV